jgi:hypothetical protein
LDASVRGTSILQLADSTAIDPAVPFSQLRVDVANAAHDAHQVLGRATGPAPNSTPLTPYARRDPSGQIQAQEVRLRQTGRPAGLQDTALATGRSVL